MVLMNQIHQIQQISVLYVARTTEAATTFVSTSQLGLSASAARVMYYREGTAMISMSAVSMALAVNSAKTHTAPSLCHIAACYVDTSCLGHSRIQKQCN